MLFSVFSFGQSFNIGYVSNEAREGFMQSSMHSIISASDGTTVTVHNLKLSTDSKGDVVRNVEVLKVDASGQILWSNEYGSSIYDNQINSICQTDDGGYMLVGSRGKLDQAVRDWILRLAPDGSVVWEKVYFDSFNSELLVVARTSEGAENYFISGRRSCTGSLISDGHITAMKVDDSGNYLWYNEYKDENYVIGTRSKTDIVTSMVENPVNGNFVLTGLNGRTAEFGDVISRKLDGDVFAIEIDLNGEISLPYRTYEVLGGTLGQVVGSAPPFINLGLGSTSYAIGFGVGNSGLDGRNFGRIAFMPLKSDLKSNFVTLYEPQADIEARASSIYPDPSGFYALSCTADRTENTLYTSDSDRVSLLKLRQDGLVLDYISYDSGNYPGCNGMAPKFDKSGYILKTDFSFMNIGSIGLIHVDLNGRSSCAKRSRVELDKVEVRMVKVAYKPTEVNLSESGITIDRFMNNLERLECFDLGSTLGRSAEKTGLIDEAIKVYPTILNGSDEVVNLEFTTIKEQTVLINIVNAQGQISSTRNYVTQQGVNQLTLDPLVFSTGMNFVELLDEDGTKKLVKVIKL